MLFPSQWCLRIKVVLGAILNRLAGKTYCQLHSILELAASIEGVGEIEEALKWGEPSYLTSKTKSGGRIRIAWKKSHGEQYSIYF